MKKLIILLLVAIFPIVSYANSRGEQLHNLVRNEICEEFTLLLIDSGSDKDTYITFIDFSGFTEITAAKKLTQFMKRFEGIELREPWTKVKQHLNCIYSFEKYFLMFKLGKLQDDRLVLVLISTK